MTAHTAQNQLLYAQLGNLSGDPGTQRSGYHAELTNVRYYLPNKFPRLSTILQLLLLTKAQAGTYAPSSAAVLHWGGIW